MNLKNIVILFIGLFIFGESDAFAQKKNQWTDTLEYAAARGKKTVLCGDEMFFTSVDQEPFIKEAGKKVEFKQLLQQKLDAMTGIDGSATITVEIVVNCKGVAGSLKLLKYGDKENPAELALIKALNAAIAELPDFIPGKNAGRVVNYKIDKMKFKTANGKITFN